MNRRDLPRFRMARRRWSLGQWVFYSLLGLGLLLVVIVSLSLVFGG